MDYNAIAKVAIYPAIGFARIGNSPKRYFFGPEIPGPHPTDPSDFRDRHGRIKRQAARFRVYALDSQGEILGELTAQNAEITWAAHIANKKAAWYNFDQAFDVPASKGEISGVAPLASLQRNVTVTGTDRQKLVIDPGQRVISGANTNNDGSQLQYAFNTGTFFGTPVYLGELRTDEQGHLIFLGGMGVSAPYNNQTLTTFANNDGWHDDVSDGSIEATVKLPDGKMLQAEGAWVVVGPPNYAPGIEAFATGYDLVYEVATQLDPKLKPSTIGFYEHIYPILSCYSLNQWVNAGVAQEYGWGNPRDFTDPILVARMADPSDASRPLRQAVFTLFRNPNYKIMESTSLPPIYGDAVTLTMSTTDPREWMAILPTQYEWLQQWAVGNFVTDQPIVPKTWNQMTPSEQANGLTRAALEETLGGPFHPGAEFTWPLRHVMMYSSPFRIKRRNTPQDDYGREVTSSVILAAGGPLDGSAPGDLSRWMAVPWQTDTSSCLSAYRAYSGEYLPTFWPARVPNDVLTSDNYAVLMDSHSSINDKEVAFSIRERKKWLRGIVYDDHTFPPTVIARPGSITTFTEHWSDVGIVVQKPGPSGNLFPQQLWVETGRNFPDSGVAPESSNIKGEVAGDDDDGAVTPRPIIPKKPHEETVTMPQWKLDRKSLL